MTSGANVVEVGTWEPMQGLVLEDDLFPHVTGGLRGRVLTVASMDVSTFNSVKENCLFQLSAKCSFDIN